MRWRSQAARPQLSQAARPQAARPLHLDLALHFKNSDFNLDSFDNEALLEGKLQSELNLQVKVWLESSNRYKR